MIASNACGHEAQLQAHGGRNGVPTKPGRGAARLALAIDAREELLCVMLSAPKAMTCSGRWCTVTRSGAMGAVRPRLSSSGA
jgi:hypothetical protein